DTLDGLQAANIGPATVAVAAHPPDRHRPVRAEQTCRGYYGLRIEIPARRPKKKFSKSHTGSDRILPFVKKFQSGPRRSLKGSLKQEFWLFKRLEYRGRLLEGIMMNSKGAILIVFAWAMEAVGVTRGIVNSTYTTFGENLPNTFVGYIPALPMA